MAQVPEQDTSEEHHLRCDTDKVDGREIDWSKHTCGGLGVLHDGERLLRNPRPRANGADVQLCTFADIQRRAAEQSAWSRGPASLWEPGSALTRMLSDYMGADPQASARATILYLGVYDDRHFPRVHTVYLDTTYNVTLIGHNALDMYVLNSGLCIPMGTDHHQCIVSLSEGEYAFVLRDGTSQACLVRWPELKSRPSTVQVEGRRAEASRKERTCEACGQVWYRSMNKCGACGEVAYCSRICQRHHWPSHKAACKRSRAQPRRKTGDDSSLGMRGVPGPPDGVRSRPLK